MCRLIILVETFVGHADEYADYDGTSFTFTSPNTGDKALVTIGSNAGNLYTFSDEGWGRLQGQVPEAMKQTRSLNFIRTGSTQSVAADGTYIFNTIRPQK